MRKILYIIAIPVAALVAIAAFIAFELMSMQRRINAANVTALLSTERNINLNSQFNSDDGCILPAEAFAVEWASRMRPDYHPVTLIDPDGSLYWTIFAFDGKKKSYRYYIVNRRTVELDGSKSYCSDRVSLSIRRNNNKEIEAAWIATVGSQ
jgi:hypothetical protein